MIRYTSLALLCAVISLGLIGCGGGTNGPPRFEVKGTISWNGSPVEGATVTYLLKGTGYSATAVTDAQGQYSLKATAGENLVMVSKTESVEKSTSIGGAEMPTSVASEGGSSQDYKLMETKYLLPGVYSTSDSALRAQVEEGGANSFDFTLSGAAGPPSAGGTSAGSAYTRPPGT